MKIVIETEYVGNWLYHKLHFRFQFPIIPFMIRLLSEKLKRQNGVRTRMNVVMFGWKLKYKLCRTVEAPAVSVCTCGAN